MDRHVLPEASNGVVAKNTLEKPIVFAMVAMAARIAGDEPLEETGFSAGKGAGTEQVCNPCPVCSPPSLFRFNRIGFGRLCNRGEQ
eukprot:7177564-Heterocapsa_arctica.AAC.1